METKLCRHCNTIKLKTDFNKCKPNKDGLQKYCRDCTKKFGRQNKERRAARKGRVMKPYEEKKFAHITEDELLMYLRKFTEIHGRPPTTSDLEGNPDYPCAYTYYRRFRYKVPITKKADNWNAILQLSGIEPLDYFSIWRAWEYLVECTIKLFESDYVFQSTNITKDYRPDIVIPSKKLIIDAATSNYDSKHKKRQFKHAMEHGYTVEFWCLYKTTKNGINEPYLKYVFADEIIEKLQAIGEDELIHKIQTLLTKHDTYTEEILAHKKEYIKAKILEMATLLKRTPKYRDFFGKPDFPSATTIKEIFGSFNEALIYAGLTINKKANATADPQIAINDLIQLTETLGRLPKIQEIGPPNTTYTIKVYRKHWGNLSNCLQEHGYKLDKQTIVDSTTIKEDRVFYLIAN
ncbi:homing endonuclease associated repeat-containing protein [Lysinibacillus sp. LZ02]|uniref:homing endonuclease associated repeat-containing protein n=1 Tax=Lysinibacillus sp. LZ02 TaxID=3420668 RepID=UPI003D36129F